MMKFYQKKEVSLEKEPILFPLERRHTLAGGREPDPGRHISRANSVGSVGGLGTPPGMAPPAHKCRSEDKRLSRAPTIVITESELSSSLLYNNRKAKMQQEAANEPTTPVSTPQTSRRPPSPRPSPRPKPAERSSKRSTVCCSYAMIALFICLASVGILLAIGGIIYMELFSAYTAKASTKDSPGADALGEAEGKSMDSVLEDNEVQSDLKMDRFGVVKSDKDRNEIQKFLKKVEEVPLFEPSTPDETSDLDLSFLRGLYDKAFSGIPEELSKMLPAFPDFVQKEESQADRQPDITKSEMNVHKEVSEEVNDDSVKSSTPKIVEDSDSHKVANPQSPNVDVFDKMLTDSSLNEKTEVLNPPSPKDVLHKGLTESSLNEKTEDLNGDKIESISDLIHNIENSVSHEIANPEEQKLHNTFEIREESISSESHSKTNEDEHTPGIELSPIVTEESNSSNFNDSEVSRPVDESRALPLEFFQRLGFDRNAIEANPLLSVDDMNVKFSISEALKVLRNLDNNLPTTREKSTVPAKVRKVQKQDVGKERREYLAKLRKNLYHMNRRR